MVANVLRLVSTGAVNALPSLYGACEADTSRLKPHGFRIFRDLHYRAGPGV